MPLGDPPVSGRLRTLPRLALDGRTLFRVFQRSRPSPWFFAALPAGLDSDAAAGRFDLPLPDGTCYLATSIGSAVLEALQGFGEGLLPGSELRARACADVPVPDAADFTDRVVRGVALFDRAGVHAPYGDDEEWVWISVALSDSTRARACLAAHGITVTVDPDLAVVRLQDSGLV